MKFQLELLNKVLRQILFLLITCPLHQLTEENIPWHILFGMHHSMVSTTIIAGKIIRKNYTFVDIDEEEILANAFEQSKIVWKKYSEQFVDLIINIKGIY